MGTSARRCPRGSFFLRRAGGGVVRRIRCVSAPTALPHGHPRWREGGDLGSCTRPAFPSPHKRAPPLDCVPGIRANGLPARQFSSEHETAASRSKGTAKCTRTSASELWSACRAGATRRSAGFAFRIPRVRRGEARGGQKNTIQLMLSRALWASRYAGSDTYTPCSTFNTELASTPTFVNPSFYRLDFRCLRS